MGKKGKERGKKGEERARGNVISSNGGEKPADGLLPFLLVNCSARGLFSMVLEIKMLRIRPNPGSAV